MRLVIQQPQFMAWVGYWAKVRASERLVMYAGVKFDKSDHQHRVTLDDGLWVGMQVGDGARNQLIKDVVVHDYTSLRKLAKTMVQKFPKRTHPYVDRLSPLIERLETWQGQFMLDLNLDVQTILMEVLQVKTDLWVDLKDRRPKEKIDKLKEAVWSFGRVGGRFVAEYYMGAGGLDYMGYDSLPETPIYVQEKNPEKPEPSPHSIVQLIAREEYPERLVDAAYVWRGQDMQVHRVVDGLRVEGYRS